MAGAVCFFFTGETVPAVSFAFGSRDVNHLVLGEYAAPAFFRALRARILSLLLGGVTLTMLVCAIGCRGSDNMWPAPAFETAPTGRWSWIGWMFWAFGGIRREREVQSKQTKRCST